MEQIIVKRILRGSWICLLLVAAVISVYCLFPLLYPFIVAWCIAYVLNPFVSWLQLSIRLPRWLAVIIGLAVYLGSAAIVLAAAVTKLVKELIHLTESLDVHIMKWREMFTKWAQSDGIQNLIIEINRFVQDNPGYGNTLNKNIDNTAMTITAAISRFINGVLTGIVNIIASLPNFGVIVIVILLSVFFISNNRDRDMTFLRQIIPTNLRTMSSQVWQDLQKALTGFLRSQFIMISITSCIVFIGLLVLQVDSPFTYALMIGIVDLLPYLGVGTVMIPWAIYSYLTGNTALAIGLSILFGVILIVRQVVEPKVLSSSVGLNPFPTLISTFIGLKLFGVFGLIIGPFSLVILNAMIRAGIFHNLWNYIMYGRSI